MRARTAMTADNKVSRPDAEDRPELLRHREGHEEIRDRQQLFGFSGWPAAGRTRRLHP
jgi:hypothetical protein